VREAVEILLILIPLSTVLVGLAVTAFVWAVRDGQFDASEDAARLPDEEPR
jgi:cbb3-type cytochrome oxidase maturation protein